MKSLIILSGFLMLSGCSTIYKLDDAITDPGKRYQEPLNGKTAQVRVFYNVGSDISIYPNTQVKSDMFKDPDGGAAITKRNRAGLMKVTYEPKSLGMPDAPKELSNFGEFKVPADRFILVKMSYSNLNNIRSESCPLKVFKVKFEENKNYTLNMGVGSRCHYQLYENKDNKFVNIKEIEQL
ncbi:hypothetical protein KTI63_05030 [Acinetobacter guillouiae]|uniref:hypothetical protein n=1 Tax=Acinetobacter guillouiae TaxID=106649 RepID=UPI0021CFC23E|nr:hypothetical protein [Acinetobacter guillouiae]MCU4491834.1 hypothetical protein [Acinetobacter guillouiae]